MTLHFFLWRYMKDIEDKILVIYLDELMLRIVVAIETVTLEVLENSWKEIVHEKRAC
jgi:hypothetical protein